MHRIYEEEKEFVQLIRETLSDLPEHKFKTQILRKYYKHIVDGAKKVLEKYPEFENIVYLIKSIIFKIPIGDYICDTCSKMLKYDQIKTNIARKHIQHFCSNQCKIKFFNEHPEIKKNAQEKKKRTSIKKYGVDHAWKDPAIKKKSRDKVLKHWEGKGISNPFQDEEVKNKIIRTCMERYGVEHAVQTENTQNKIKETCLEKYGVQNAFQSDIIKRKIKDTCIERYGVENYVKTKEFWEKYKITSILNWGTEFPAQNKELQEKLYNARKRNGTLNRSWMEKELFENIQKVIIEAIPNDRGVLNGYELDIIIPSKKIAIEFNGRHWHKHDMDSLFKKELCEKVGWKLYVVKEPDWRIDKKNEIEKCLEFIRNN
jgi:hypothetical protein